MRGKVWRSRAWREGIVQKGVEGGYDEVRCMVGMVNQGVGEGIV